jgi:tryptophan synthase beta chain
VGVLHGALSYLLHDFDGQISESHSVSAGLDYPGVGPEHANLKEQGLATYTSVSDAEALDATRVLATVEGIIPALESAHALAHAIRLAPTMSGDELMVVCLSGRGDKDLETIRKETSRA